MHVQTTGAFNIIGAISALLYSSIFLSKALRLRAAGNGAWSLQSSAQRKGHLHRSLKRKVQPLKSQRSCGTDMRGMGRAVWQTQECSQRCHTGRDGEGSPGLGSRRHWQSWCGEPWAGCRSEQRSAGLKELHTAPDCALSDSSLCFQLLASINIATLELEILTPQPPSPLGTEYFLSLEEQLRPAAFLNKSRKTAGARRHRGRVPASCLNAACTTHDQFKCLPKSSQT